MAGPTDVVIPVHGALTYLKTCVSTLVENTPFLNRIIFMDDSSDLETTAFMLDVLRTHKSSLYVRSEKQRWFTRASNLGLRMVRTDRAVLLNSDCILDKGWLEELYDVWSDAESQSLRVGLVGSILSQEEPRRWADIREPGYVTGHCWLLGMAAISEISSKRGTPGWYLDETQDRTIHIFSDNELCAALNRNGYATIASFKSPVGHVAGKSWGHDLSKLHGLHIGDPLKGEVLGSR